MRDVLYRAKPKNLSAFADAVREQITWVYGSPLVNRCSGLSVQIFEQRNGKLYNWEVDPETLGQWTGLKDKNGKKIFEGDIVRGRAYSMEFRGYIIWIDEIGSFGLRTGHDIAAQNCTILDRANRGMNDEFSAEIIGNIHDNPELLEGIRP